MRNFPFLFVILVFGVTAITSFMPLRYHDLQMFIPGGVALYCLILRREKILPLFRLGSISGLIYGIMLPIIALFIVMGVAWAFSFARFGWPQEALIYSQNSELMVFRKMFLYAWPSVFALGMIFALGEEFGWRGYLLQKIQYMRIGLVGRAIIVGLIWGAWHLPSYVLQGETQLRMGIFMVNVVLISICMSWLYEQKKSIWPAVLLHATHNFAFNYFLTSYTLSKNGPAWLHGEEGVLVGFAYVVVLGVLLARKKI